jgi:hypothetical protein
MTTVIVASAILILASVGMALRPVRKPLAVPVKARR